MNTLASLSWPPILAAVLCCFAQDDVEEAAAAAEPEPPAVWIYRDVPPRDEPDERTDTEKRFQPYGFMPAARVDQIVVDAERLVDPEDPEEGTCIEYRFRFLTRPEWMGVFTLVDGTEWGTAPGIDVRTLLGVAADAPVELKFRARGRHGGERVTFQVGAIDKGKYRSSLRMPRKLRPAPTVLTKEWVEYTIPLSSDRLGNVPGPFAVVSTSEENPRLEELVFEVDDVRFVEAR